MLKNIIKKIENNKNETITKWTSLKYQINDYKINRKWKIANY